MKLQPLIALLVIATSSCQDSIGDRLPGAYAREYSFEHRVLSSGKVLGRVTIRDTIFIKKKKAGYEIANRRWRKNDWDNNGWIDQEHSFDRPRFTYEARLDPTDSSLIATNGLYQPILVDIEGNKLYLTAAKQDFYQKVSRD